MLSPYDLTEGQRDLIYAMLNEEQIQYIQETMTRGKRTRFARAMATNKGSYVPEGASYEDIEQLVDDWIYLEYKDAGYVSDQLKCECGRSLRYQHTVQNKNTAEILRFGITHLELHTGIDATIVTQIKNGFNAIDFELDEVLHKYKIHWDIRDEMGVIPAGVEIPEDIKEHLQLGLPLLDRQISRLQRIVRLYLDRHPVKRQPNMEMISSKDSQVQRLEINDENTGSLPLFPPPEEVVEVQVELDLFGESVEEDTAQTLASAPSSTTPHVSLERLTPFLEELVVKHLQCGVSSARVICELLIKSQSVSDVRFITSKPHIYVPVCQYIDQRVAAGHCECLESDIDFKDRKYRWIGSV